MIKRITGIATILLLILVIGIGIAKADTKNVAKLHQHDQHGLASEQLAKVDKGMHLKDACLLPALDKVLKESLSLKESRPAMEAKGVSKHYALPEVWLSEATPDKFHGYLGPVVLEGQSLTNLWNKDAVKDV